MVVNIKDFSKYPLESDTIKTASKCGFTLHKIETLEQSSRCGVYKNKNKPTDVNENIYVFIKTGTTPIQTHPTVVDLW